MAEVNYTVKTMTKEDVPKALDVWKETGMQEGAHCIDTWFAFDPEAFKIAVTDDGEVIGACSACLHNEDLAFVGMYCVREKYRGQGIGFKVWSACMEHIGSRNASLNAAPGKLELYRDKGGFPIVESDWVSVVYETKSAVQPDNLTDVVPPNVDIGPFEDSHLTLMYDYDQKLMGYNRYMAIKLNCKEQNSRTLVALSDGACVGFGTIKISCYGTGMVGPLYADDKDIAEVILRRLILALPQAKGFVMMTVSANKDARQLMKKLGCPIAEQCERLYRKEKVNVDLSKVFAHFDLNFSPF